MTLAVLVLHLVWSSPSHGSLPAHEAAGPRLLLDVASLEGFDEYSWMWGDAGTNLLGHGLAETDLLRWSEWKNSAATIRDLEAFRTPGNNGRPVEMIGVHSHGMYLEPRPNLDDVRRRSKMNFENMQEAIRYLSMHRSEYSWMWGDSGTHFLGHRMAEMDPLRWSAWESQASIVEDLEHYRTAQNLQRPVEIRKDGQSKVMFANLDEALKYLQGQGRAQGAGQPEPPAAEPLAGGAPMAVAPMPVPAPVPVPAPAPAPRERSGLAPGEPTTPTPRPLAMASGSSAESKVYLTDSTVHVLLTTLVVLALAFCGCLGCCFFHGKIPVRQDYSDEEYSDDENEGDKSPLRLTNAQAEAPGPHASQAFRGATNEAIRDADLQRLLKEVEDLDRASPGSSQLAALPSSPSSRANAKQEVERILASRDVRTVLGGGSPEQQKAEFRRLLRVLHPDKGLVSGERATLALRRVVEYHAVLLSPAATDPER